VCFHYRRHAASASSAKAIDGTRFRGERAYFHLAAAQVRARGWHRAERAAQWHLTSRLHAITLVAGALRARNPEAVRILLGHAFRPGTAAR